MTGKNKTQEVFIHPTSVVSPKSKIGAGTKVWCFSQIMDNAVIGKNCVIGQCVYIDREVRIGNNVKIHNKASIYHGVVIKDEVFIGPHVCMINYKRPRYNRTRNLEGVNWTVNKGASIGAGTVILPDINVGEYAMVGAGSVVTKEVPPHAVVYGNPAALKSFVCKCGEDLGSPTEKNGSFIFKCRSCGSRAEVDKFIVSKFGGLPGR